MTRRFNLRSRGLLALVLVGLALPMSGCGGCGKTDSDANQTEAQKAEAKKKDEAKKKEEEKKKKEKPKPDFEVSLLKVQPADPEQSLSAAKPGHWLSVTRKVIANNFDFVGSMEADVAVKPDNERFVPLELERQPFALLGTRNIVLPKGREKYLDQTLFIPRCDHTPWIRDKILTRGGAPMIDPASEPLVRMPAYQYYFLILARQPARYKMFARKDALLGPSENGTLSYYRVNMPRVDKYVPLPANPFAWTSTAFVLWDDVDPSLLSLEQQQAMIDWLQWGGQLLISGPDTLTLLHNSFLDPYLPAIAGKNRTLSAESLAPLAAVVQPSGLDGKPTWAKRQFVADVPQKFLPLAPVRPWNGVVLELREPAHWLPEGKPGLIAERAVGRGRIVATAFHLAERDLMNWAGFDTLLNGWLLRHPPRVYVASQDLDRSWEPEWADKNQNRFDPRLTCGLRYVSRDMGANGEFDPGEPPAPSGQPDFSKSIDFSGQSNGVNPISPDGDPLIQPDAETVGSGVGGWTDFSGIASAARESLRSAAGITIPKPTFIAWMLVAYLTILGPLNWGLCRLLGRVEWAWVAAPLIAIVGAVVVTKAAHLNIGFARSQTEIDVVELQPDYPRGHLTRYTALYTSLSTTYAVRFDDPHALVQPFAIGGESRLRQTERTVTLHRDTDVRLTDFDVSSNSTAMLHSEQMFDFGGGIGCTTEGGRLRIVNHSKYTLQQSGVVWREPDGDFSAAWIGELPPGRDRLLNFESVPDDGPALPKLLDAIAVKSNADKTTGSGSTTLRPNKFAAPPVLSPTGQPIANPWASGGSIAEIVTSRAGFKPGDMRLVGLLDEPLPGMEVTPASSQATRAGVFVVANLRYAPPPPPKPDVNLRPPKNAPVEPREPTPDAESPASPNPNPSPSP